MPLPGSWMPFPFAANVHQQYKILQPFNVASQLSGLVVGGPQLCLSCFAIHHLPSVLSPPWPHVCVTYTAWGQLCSCLSGRCQGLGWKVSVLPAAFWPDCEKKQMSPTSESKDSQKMALRAAGHADGFPMSQEKRLLGRRRRGRR